MEADRKEEFRALNNARMKIYRDKTRVRKYVPRKKRLEVKKNENSV